MSQAREIGEPASKLGVLLQGMGAVATTFIAGVELVKKGLAEPVGSLTQFGTVRLGKRTEGRASKIKDFVPRSGMGDLVFEQRHVVRPSAAHKKEYGSLREAAEIIRDDIRRFQENGLRRVVMIYCASTDAHLEFDGGMHPTLQGFEAALDASAPSISPSMVYAHAAIMEGVPYANGAPSLAADVPALTGLANERGVPITGKGFKTGQTWMKTVVAPGIKARMLGSEGWYSTNILGNRDGEVLDEAWSLKSKKVSKLSRLDYYE